MYPITKNIPEALVQSTMPVKSQLFASIIPNNLKTFDGLTRDQRTEQYAKSWFGWTYGNTWNDPRIYEMLANGCIPFFNTNLKTCPENILHGFPKHLVLQARDLYDQITATNQVQIKKQLAEISAKLINYTKENLTTERTAKNILKVLGNPKNVLYVGGTTEDSQALLEGLMKYATVTKVQSEEEMTFNDTYNAVVFGDVHGAVEDMVNVVLKRFDPLKVAMICWEVQHDCGYVTKPCHLFLMDPTIV